MLRAMTAGLIFGVALFGCATQQKEYSPKEWREAMKDSKSSIWGPLITIEAFDASRPYQQITETLRKKSKECLDLTVHSSGMVKHGMYWVRENSRTDYKPILTTEKGKTELTVHGNKNPLYGLDVVPAGRNASRVTVYRAKMGVSSTIHSAVQGWVKGDSVTCPRWNG
jgi:hypothetical protein